MPLEMLQKAKDESERQVQQFRAEYPIRLRFYNWKEQILHDNQPPFNVTAIYTDGTSTFIKAVPDGTPTIFEWANSEYHPVQVEYRDGTCTSFRKRCSNAGNSLLENAPSASCSEVTNGLHCPNPKSHGWPSRADCTVSAEGDHDRDLGGFSYPDVVLRSKAATGPETLSRSSRRNRRLVQRSLKPFRDQLNRQQDHARKQQRN